MAELSCLHGQHVRHRPPFQERPWVVSEEGRAAWIGRVLECPRCDRAELPEGLPVARTSGPFDRDSLPAGLRRQHRVGEHTWGRLRVNAGALWLCLDTEPPLRLRLTAGEARAIPPGVTHLVELDGPVELEVDFLGRPA